MSGSSLISEHDLDPNLKLPVQNGGLYINSETTEEDKAEAVEAIKGIGLSAEAVGALATEGAIAGAYQGDCNDLPNGLWKISPEATNKPSNQPCVILHKTWDENFEIQMAFIYATWNIMFRFKNSGTWSDWDSKFLPRDGSESMSGNLNVESSGEWASVSVRDGGQNLKGYMESSPDSIGSLSLWVQDNASDVNQRRGLKIFDKTVVDDIKHSLQYHDYVDGVVKPYIVYGEHNKPSGSYTGNGSATSRTIPLSGIGSIVYIWSIDGWAIITKKGGIGRGSSMTTLENFKYTEAMADELGIVLATTSNLLNKNGQNYYYQYL